MEHLPVEIERQAEVSRRTGISESTLEKKRLNGSGPPFVRLGRRSIGYIKSDVDAWLLARRCKSTSEYIEEA